MATRPTGKPSSRSAPATTQGVQHAIVALDSLTPHPRNYRRHSESQVARLGASLARFGQVRSIVVQEGADGRYLLVAGHGLTEAARANGYTELRADVIPATWTDTQVTGYLIADNETTRGADDDLVQLAAMLEEQRAAGEHLESLGYSDDELAALLDDLANAALAGGDKRDVDDPDGGGDDFDTTPEEDGPTRVQAGDLWQLGQHRLLCGDSTRAEDVARLMAGERADLVFTDPPYGMHLDTQFATMHKANGFGKGGKNYAPVIGDDKPFDPAGLLECFEYCDEQFWWGADYYRDKIPAGGSWVVWDKRESEMNLDALIGSAFELCWSKQQHKREIARILWAGHHGMGKPGDTKSRVHPTQKPVGLVAWFFERYGDADDIVVDAFLGSGTTLIACERTGRRCYGIELDTRYCDVIIRRWEQETGRQAEKISCRDSELAV